jgi:hypothetical protein
MQLASRSLAKQRNESASEPNGWKATSTALVIAEARAATVPALKDTILALKTALEGEKARLADFRADRDRLAARREP